MKVEVGAKKEEILEVKKDTFHIKVKEKAENNLANDKILKILKNQFYKDAKNLKIVSGHHKPSKMIVAEY